MLGSSLLLPTTTGSFSLLLGCGLGLLQTHDLSVALLGVGEGLAVGAVALGGVGHLLGVLLARLIALVSAGHVW